MAEKVMNEHFQQTAPSDARVEWRSEVNGFAQQAHILEQIGLKYQPNMRHRERIQEVLCLTLPKTVHFE